MKIKIKFTRILVIKIFSVLILIATGCLLMANAACAITLGVFPVILSLAFFTACFAFWIYDEAKQKNKRLKSYIPTFAIILLGCIAYAIWFTPPPAALITTGRYGHGTPEENETVDAILGEARAKERFELYFQWFNVLHETGHCIVWFNGGSRPQIVDEEQLVNDFAVAFWTYYGEEEKLGDLRLTVAQALDNIGRPPDKYANHLEYARDNWGKSGFFTFRNYGWFQFSCVNGSLGDIKPLESVLAEMGVANVSVRPKRTLAYPAIGEGAAAEIIGDAVAILREWGATIPAVYHTFDDNPNNHMIQIKRNVFGSMDRSYILAIAEQ